MPLLRHTYIHILLYAGIVSIALILRFYNFDDAVSFRGDSAWDLYIARSVVDDGHKVLIGPQLSVQNFTSPPTYYYFLSWLYDIFRTPQGVTFAFAIMNLLAMYCMVRLAVLLIGKEAGFIMAFLFAVSSIMVGQSHMMWQPYPLTLAIALSLLLLVKSNRNKSIFLFFLSLLSYMFALSVYISPILLFPYYFHMGARFFKDVYSYQNVKGSLVVLAFMVLAGVPFYGGYMYTEWLHGFPSYTTLQSPAFGAPQTIRSAYDMYLKYVFGFIEDVFGQTAVKTVDVARAQYYINWLVVILMLLPGFFRKYFHPQFDSVKNSVKFFVALPWLLAGSFIILWFQKSMYAYRIHVFIPFFMIGFTFVLYLALKSRRNIFSVLACALMVIYTVGNILDIQLSRFYYSENEVERAARAAIVIGYDAARTGVKKEEMAVKVLHNYNIFPFLYYLRDFADYALPLIPGGNDIDRDAPEYLRSYQYVYVICVKNGRVPMTTKECEANFMEENPLYQTLSSLKVNDQDHVIKFALRSK